MIEKLFLVIRRIFTLPILIYRKLISPMLPNSCIYSPSCSSYGMDSIMKHGIFKGALLGIARIFRCIGGFYTGGEDPVPEAFTFKYVFGSYGKFRTKKKTDK